MWLEPAGLLATQTMRRDCRPPRLLDDTQHFPDFHVFMLTASR